MTTLKNFITVPGLQVKTLRGELDQDEESNERHTPAGTVGWVERSNHVDDSGVEHWDVLFPNGAWVVLSDEELHDSAQYACGPPNTLRQHCLRLRYGQEVQGLTILDDALINSTVAVAADRINEVLALVKARDEQK